MQEKFKIDILNKEIDQLAGSIKTPIWANEERRFDVYINNVYSSLTEALRDNFSAINNLVGMEYFDYIAHKYIKNYPPKQAALIYYGDNFAEFLEQNTKKFPYLKDVANFEYAWLRAYFSDDDKPLTIDNFAKLTDKDILYLRSSAHLLNAEYEADKIWQYAINFNDYDIKLPNINPQNIKILLFRRNGEIEFIRLNNSEYMALFNLQNGKNLGDILTNYNNDITKFLGKILSLGILKNISL